MAKKSNWDDDNGIIMPEQSRYNPSFNAPQRGMRYPSDTADSGVTQQLPPIVQPLVIVPYSTQMQPLLQYAPDRQMGYGENYGEFLEYDEDEAPAKRKGSVSFAAILLMILGLLTAFLAVVCMLGKIIDPALLSIYKDLDGIEKVLFLPDLFGGDLDIKALLVPVGLAGVVVSAAIIFLFSLFSIKKGPSVIVKIFAALEVVFAALIIVTIMLIEKLSVGLASYIIIGLSVVTLLIALIGKKRGRR